MAKVEVTMEKTYRIAMEFEATAEQIEMLESGYNPFADEMEKKIDHGDIDYDYAAVDMETGREIMSWR